jgi:putative transposase
MAKRHLGLKIELDPTRAQATMLASHAGARRFAYNWAIETADMHYWTMVRPAREAIRAEDAARDAEIAAIEAAEMPVPDGLRGRQAMTQPVFRYSTVDLVNIWNREKRSAAPWIGEVGAMAMVQAVLDAGHTIGKYIDGLTGNGPRIGKPQFKAKGKCRDAFRVSGDVAEYTRDKKTREVVSTSIRRFPVTAKSVTLPRIGIIRTKQDITGRMLPGDWVTSATVSRSADRWFISLKIRREAPEVLEYVPDKGRVIGVDVGVSNFAVCSDGVVIASSKPLKAAAKTLRRQQRDCSRKRNVAAGVKTKRMKRREAHAAAQAGVSYWPSEEERKTAKSVRRQEQEAVKAGRKAELAVIQAEAQAAGLPAPKRLPRVPEQKSVRLAKAETTVARTHLRVANCRSNFLHETTTRLVRRAAKCGASISIEGLRVANMMKNHKLARAIADQGWGEFRRQMMYKTDWAGVPLFIAPANFPSSKTCSRCGVINEALTLADRAFSCGRCGLRIDRDLNAARNLRYRAVMAIARGESGRPDALAPGQDSVKRRLAPRRSTASAGG